MKKLTILAALAAAVIVGGCFDAHAQEEDTNMKILVAAGYNFNEQSGGSEISFMYDIGDRFFAIAQAETGPAMAGTDEDEAGMMYGVTTMLGAKIFATDWIAISLLGGVVDQWWAFSQLADGEVIEVNRNYVESAGGLMVAVAPGSDRLEVFVAGQYTDPIKNAVAVNPTFDITVGVAVPF